MQVKDAAALAGTTVRAVRHYHAIGLLPVPEVRNGRRDYDVSHVARISRIRWLAESGVPLARIGAILAEEPTENSTDARADVLSELRATLDVVKGRIAALAAQKDRLGELLSALERGEALSPLPPAPRCYYESLERLAPDETTRQAVRREREFLELAYLRGEVPAEAELIFEGIDEQHQRATLSTFARLLSTELTDDEVEEIAGTNVDRIVSRLGREAEPAGSLDADAVRRLYQLFDAVDLAGDRRIGAAMLRRLLAHFDQGETPRPNDMEETT